MGESDSTNHMKVYVALGTFDWEGSTILEIFAVKELAEEYVEKLRVKIHDHHGRLVSTGGYDSYSVAEHDVLATSLAKKV